MTSAHHPHRRGILIGKTYQHPVRDRGGNRERGLGSGVCSVMEVSMGLEVVRSSLGAMMGNTRARLREGAPFLGVIPNLKAVIEASSPCQDDD
jgi:hypothetical protein